MGQHHSRREVGLAILLMAGIGMGCAHTREVFYPRVPRRAARLRRVPKARIPAPVVGARVREVPKIKPIVKVE